MGFNAKGTLVDCNHCEHLPLCLRGERERDPSVNHDITPKTVEEDGPFHNATRVYLNFHINILSSTHGEGQPFFVTM